MKVSWQIFTHGFFLAMAVPSKCQSSPDSSELHYVPDLPSCLMPCVIFPKASCQEPSCQAGYCNAYRVPLPSASAIRARLQLQAAGLSRLKNSSEVSFFRILLGISIFCSVTATNSPISPFFSNILFFPPPTDIFLALWPLDFIIASIKSQTKYVCFYPCILNPICDVSLATRTIRVSCHNCEMIVGDGYGLWKTKGGQETLDIEARKPCFKS